jgi:predicted nucleic acid-binding protein
MRLLVLDASVAAKWFLPRTGEGLTEEAFDLLRRHGDGEIDFTVPDLFWAEFGNVLWKAVRLGRWSETDAARALQQMQAQRLAVVHTKDLIEDALSIALANSRTVYDSIYIALAVQNGAEVVTADERLANAVASRLPVKWLGALQLF